MNNDRHWLNGERLRGYPGIFFALYGVFGIVCFFVVKDGIDPLGKPIGYDFITYWSASRMALDGTPADAYLPLRLLVAQQIAVPGQKTIFAWHYPPTFYLVVLPLSLLPYLWSYVSFVALTFAMFWSVVRKVVPLAGAGALILAFPGVFINALHGQNGFLTGALLGASLLLLERRPVWAGVCAGLLLIKPHLAVLLPIAFICMQAWKALFAAALTAMAFLAISVGVLGGEVLTAFLGNLRLVHLLLEQGFLPWSKMPTYFAFASLLGASTFLAYALQAIGAIFAVCCVGWIWRQRVDYELKAAALVAGTFLVSPYLFDYDLVLLALPLAWFGVYGLRAGWRFGERNLLALCWLLPILVAPLSKSTHIQIAPFILLALLLAVLRRVREGGRYAA